jgi:hypothetical protein
LHKKNYTEEKKKSLTLKFINKNSGRFSSFTLSIIIKR